LSVEEGVAVLTNTGSVPALGACVRQPGHAHTFTPEDGFLWIDPGETRRIKVDSTEGLTFEALNVDEPADVKKAGGTKTAGARKTRAK
jgi:hypothetical protein